MALGCCLVYSWIELNVGEITVKCHWGDLGFIKIKGNYFKNFSYLVLTCINKSVIDFFYDWHWFGYHYKKISIQFLSTEIQHKIAFASSAKHHNTLQWHHNECNGISNHQHLDCLLSHLFMRRSKKTSKLRVTGLCEGNSPVTSEFPAQRSVTWKMFPFDDIIMFWDKYSHFQCTCTQRGCICISPQCPAWTIGNLSGEYAHLGWLE